mgnify:CR=1 FL=1
MLLVQKKRTKRLTKFTEEEIEFISNFDSLDLATIKNNFEEKFKKTITKEYISIIKKKS